MRHSRSLTSSENWELATMLAIIVLVLVGVTLCWRLGKFPQLWAALPETSTVAPVALPDGNRLPVQFASQEESPLRVAMPNYQKLTPAGQLWMAAYPIHVRHHHPRPTDAYWYHGRKYVYWKTLFLRVTSYAPDRRCCWPYNGTTTASGKSVWTNDGHLVAADTHLIPFNCMVRVPGYDHNHPVPVLDRGGAIQGYRLDVLLPTFWQAQHWGAKLLRVKIYQPAY